MAARWLAVLGVVLLALSALAAPDAARAQQVPRLDGRIVDQTGRLGDPERRDAEAAFRDAESRGGVQLFALLVDTTAGTPAPRYAEDVARANGLGGNDVLVVLALDDRRYGIWLAPMFDGSISDDEVDRLFAERVERRLADERWGEALAETARGLGEAATGAAPRGGDTPAGESGGVSFGTWLMLGLVVLGAVLAWQALRRRRTAAPASGQPAEPLRDVGELAREANLLLLETDESVRQNEQELGFAEAEFGEAEAEPFRLALAEARQSLRAAFTLRQQLDDSEPESEQEQRAMLQEIAQRCQQAQAVMDAQREHFQQLRNLERDAPKLLEQLRASIETAEARTATAEQQLGRIQDDAPGSAQGVAGNIAEARKRLATAREVVAAGLDATRRGERGPAGRSVRAAEELLAQSTALLDAVAQLDAQLVEARTEREALRADVRSDVAHAHELLRQHPDPALGARLDAVEAALGAAGAGDVLSEYRALQEADTAANALLAALSEGAEQRRRAEQALRIALHNAEQKYDRAAAYIAGRRHGVGRVPRTRLAEAERELERARERHGSDPQAALASADRAGQLADRAYELAREEFGRYDDEYGGGDIVIGGSRAGRGGQWGADVGSVVIGTIIGSILSGGGGGGRRGGGFGGGGRTFGGGFGGGGGRSRGGAW